MEPLLMGIDIGTSACRAALFTANGDVVAQDSGEYPVYHPQVGWAEQNPDDWWQGVCTTVQKILEEHSIDARRIAGNPVTMRMAFELAANKSDICFIGTPHTELAFSPKQWENMNRKEFNLTGSWMSYSAPFPGKEWDLTAHYFATGQLKFDASLIFKTFPLSEAAEAFELYKNPSQVHGKIMLIPGQ